MKKQIKKFVVLALSVGMLATTVLGASAAFDPAYYAAQNPDVVKALGNSPEMLKKHYDLFGRKEARMSNKNDVEAQLRRLFNADDYAKLFPDVQKAFGADKEAMFSHYMAFGLLEGRRPSEKVSQATANALKKSVEKAMKDAGIAATPGSAEVVAVLTGDVAADSVAITQVAENVTTTLEAEQKPATTPSSSSSSSSAPATNPSDSTGTNVSEPKDWTEVGTEAELIIALAQGKKGIKLSGTITNLSTGAMTVSSPVVLDLSGNSITTSAVAFEVKADMILRNGTVNGNVAWNSTTKPGAMRVWKGATLTLGDGENAVTVVNNSGTGVVVKDGGNLTMKKNSTVSAPNDYGVILIDNMDTSGANTSSKIEVYGNITAKWMGLYVNGLRHAGDIVYLEGANITASDTSDSHAVYLAGSTNATVKYSTLKGDVGLEVRAGTLDIVESDFISTGTVSYSFESNSNGTTIKGAALAVSQHVTNKQVDVTVDSKSTIVEHTNGKAVVVANTDAENAATSKVNVTIDGIGVLQGGTWVQLDKAPGANSKINFTFKSKGAGVTVSGNDVSNNALPVAPNVKE